MESRKIALQETAIVATGTVLCAAVMVGVFALLGYFDISVVWGAAVGSLISVANFFVMALCAGLAADKATNQDVKGGQLLIQFSYIGRMIMLFALWFLCYSTGVFNMIALVVPVVFTQPVITIAEFFRKSGEKKS